MIHKPELLIAVLGGMLVVFCLVKDDARAAPHPEGAKTDAPVPTPAQAVPVELPPELTYNMRPPVARRAFLDPHLPGAH